MDEPLWRGVGVALVTLFDGAGAVDADATAAHAARLVAAGVRAVLVAGSTGEADTLSDAERVALVEAVRAACPGTPVLAGASGSWLDEAAGRGTAVAKAGADALLVAPPRRCVDVPGFYAGLVGRLPTVPVLAYHFPGTAGAPVPVEALAELPVAGLKDSTGSAERLVAELEAWSGWTYVGNAMLTLAAGTLGAAGAILAVANVYPELAVDAFGGDAAAQRRLLATHVAAGQRFPYGLKEQVAGRYGTPVHARA
jgi:4-hydroxy-tetrahydrodipicolinate synthase